jgi:futalosine hydrolase
MIVVVCAAAAELAGFARAGVDVVAVGVGPIEAALGTLRALGAKRYSLVINAGIGGAFVGRAAVGDAVIVTDDRFVDLGREDRSALALPAGLRLEDWCAGDAETLARYRAFGPPAVFGSGVTSATITTSAGRAAALAALYAPAVESMEGFAVLRAAAAAGVPAVGLRGISNLVADARGDWDFRAGSSAAVRALEGLLDVIETAV